MCYIKHFLASCFIILFNSSYLRIWSGNWLIQTALLYNLCWLELPISWKRLCRTLWIFMWNVLFPGKYSLGQNLALGPVNWEATMLLWHNEVKDFIYGDNTVALHAVGECLRVLSYISSSSLYAQVCKYISYMC